MKSKNFIIASVLALQCATFAYASGASYGEPMRAAAVVSSSGAHYGAPDSQPAPRYIQAQPVRVSSDEDHSFSHDAHNRVYWLDVNAGMPMPRNAVIGGRQNEHPRTLFVCRGNYQGGVHPGKVVAGNCNISWGGQEILLPNYQVLVSRLPLAWVPATFGYVPSNAMVGGNEDGRPLYICQANYKGGVHTGKIVDRNCNFGWGGREIAMPRYRVLIRSL